MKHDTAIAGGAKFAMFSLDGDSPQPTLELVWAHGWGQSHNALLPLAEAMGRMAKSVLLDLPGFGGASPEPSEAWSTADYADAAAEWLARNPHPNPPPHAGEGTTGTPPPQAGEGGVGVPPSRRIWIGYSYGGRVGLQLAARHPEAIDGLCLIATPGLPLRRSLPARAKMAARRLAFRVARSLAPEGAARERLRARFGSSDYARASPLMRQVLVKAVTEDLSEVARAVRVPALLIYGDQDRDASPDIGMRLNTLIPQSRLVVLRGFGHLDIVTDGQHQIVHRLSEFVERIG